MKVEKTVAGAVADAATGEVLGLDVLVERDSDGFTSPPARGDERGVAGAVAPSPAGRRSVWTNSVTERAMDGSKTRRKTARGCKSEDWTLNVFGLTRRAWSGRDGMGLSELVSALRRAVRWGEPLPAKPAQRFPIVSETLAFDSAFRFSVTLGGKLAKEVIEL